MYQQSWGVAIIIVSLASFAAYPVMAASMTESFEVDPGWSAVNLPVNGNDFGFRDSSFAGGEPGEAGGFFSASDLMAWYGDNQIGNLSGKQIISASGSLNIRDVDAQYNNNVFIGHFDGSSSKGLRGVGIQILEEPSGDQSLNPASFRILYLIGSGSDGDQYVHQGQLFIIENLDEVREWRYRYDPLSGVHGSLTIFFSGPGGDLAEIFLDAQQREAIRDLDTFGMAIEVQDTRPERLELYIDDVTYSKESEVQANPNLVLTKTADNDTPIGEELVNFTIEVGNQGDAAAETVEVVEKLPREMQIPEGLAAFTSAGNYDPATGKWEVGSIEVGQQETMSLPAQIVTKPQPPCVINTAEVTVPDDTDPGDNLAVVGLRRPDVERCVDLEIQFASYYLRGVPCRGIGTIRYNFQVVNKGLDGARDVVLELKELAFKAPGFRGIVPDSCEGLRCTWAHMPPHWRANVTFTSDEFNIDEPQQHIVEVTLNSDVEDYQNGDNMLLDEHTIQPFSNQCSIGGGGPDFGGMGGSGGCFIATAAYGSHSHPDVQVLREFRDTVLLKFEWGRALNELYYRHSPDIACYIEEHAYLRLGFRGLIKPVVLAIAYPCSILAAVLAISSGVLLVLARKRRRVGYN